MNANLNLSNLSAEQLRRCAVLKEEIEMRETELCGILTGTSVVAKPIPDAAPASTGRRTMSAASRKRISDAAKARWARVRAQQGR